jgi:pyridoxamine 5'-phosphate oxidase
MALAVAERPLVRSPPMEEHELDADPVRQFGVWYDAAQAAGVAQADATALATATPDGQPSVRLVLLKGYDERGFVFYTNHHSRKATELAANPRAAFAFFWQPLRRQVRVEGVVERVSDGESAAYFETRPRGSRLAAWASPQSRPVADRIELDALYDEADARFPGDVPLPAFWGGYRVVPHTIEFWQGRENRLHDRFRYERSGDAWTMTRLAP